MGTYVTGIPLIIRNIQPPIIPPRIITINKVITGDPLDNQTFHINISSVDGLNSVGVPITQSQPIVFTNVPYADYTVTESYIGGGYSLDTITPSTFTISANNPQQIVDIVNETVVIIPKGTLRVNIADLGDMDIETYYDQSLGAVGTYTIDWGDGTIDTIDYSDWGGGSHSYMLLDMYIITIQGLAYINSSSINIIDTIELIGIEYLSLSDTSITTPPDLSDSLNLKKLWYEIVKITEPPDFTNQTSIEEIYLSYTLITSPPILTGLTTLKTLALDGTTFTDTVDLTGLTALETLWCPVNKMATPPDLSDLSSIKMIELDFSVFTDPPDFTGLFTLENLYLQENKYSVAGLDSIFTTLTNSSFSNLAIFRCDTYSTNPKPTPSVKAAFIAAHPLCGLITN